MTLYWTIYGELGSKTIHRGKRSTIEYNLKFAGKSSPYRHIYAFYESEEDVIKTLFIGL